MYYTIIFIRNEKIKKKKKKTQKKTFFGGFFWVFWVGFLLPTLPLGQQGEPTRQPPRGGVRRGAAAAARGTRPQPEAAGPAEPRAGGSGRAAHRKRWRERGLGDDAAAQCSQSD